MSMTMLSIIKCFLKTQTTCINIKLSQHIRSGAILWAANLQTIKPKCNLSLKDHSSHILNKLTNSTTKRWTLLSSAKSWSWLRWPRSEPLDSSLLHRAGLMTSNLQSCLSNSKTCHRVWLLRLIRLKINIVLMVTWEVIRISNNITTSCRLSNRLNWSLCRIKLCKRIHNTKAKCQTRLSLCNTLTCICSRTQALLYNKQIKV